MRNQTANNTANGASGADLYWLAFLLTGEQDISVDIAADAVVSGLDARPSFNEWMLGWQRRLVIGKALTAIRDQLRNSALRTQLARVNGRAMPPSNWSLDPGTTKADLQQALLAIDSFPRAALLLLTFEGLRMSDAASLLDAEPALIRKAQAIALYELTANLAGGPFLEHRTSGEIPKRRCSWFRTSAWCH